MVTNSYTYQKIQRRIGYFQSIHGYLHLMVEENGIGSKKGNGTKKKNLIFKPIT